MLNQDKALQAARVKHGDRARYIVGETPMAYIVHVRPKSEADSMDAPATLVDKESGALSEAVYPHDEEAFAGATWYV